MNRDEYNDSCVINHDKSTSIFLMCLKLYSKSSSRHSTQNSFRCLERMNFSTNCSSSSHISTCTHDASSSSNSSRIFTRGILPRSVSSDQVIRPQSTLLLLPSYVSLTGSCLQEGRLRRDLAQRSSSNLRILLTRPFLIFLFFCSKDSSEAPSWNKSSEIYSTSSSSSGWQSRRGEGLSSGFIMSAEFG